MSTAIQMLVAREHAADLHRAAQRRRLTTGGRLLETKAPAIELRAAHADEDRVLRRLAALDEAPALAGQVMLALLDGVAVAALSLEDRRVVANPFVDTRGAVALLRLRCEYLTGPRTPRRRLPRLRGLGRPGLRSA